MTALVRRMVSVMARPLTGAPAALRTFIVTNAKFSVHTRGDCDSSQAKSVVRHNPDHDKPGWSHSSLPLSLWYRHQPNFPTKVIGQYGDAGRNDPLAAVDANVEPVCPGGKGKLDRPGG